MDFSSVVGGVGMLGALSVAVGVLCWVFGVES